jgi:hypothetical protein
MYTILEIEETNTIELYQEYTEMVSVEVLDSTNIDMFDELEFIDLPTDYSSVSSGF